MANPTGAGLLDTSVVVLLSRLREPAVLPDVPLISSVTLAELSVGTLVARTGAERAALQGVLQQAEADFDPLPFDDRAARTFGRVAASLRGSGRTVKARSYDAMVAAIAIANDLPLYTANLSSFADIDDIDVRAVTVPTTSGS